jgi:hypothetical protein
MTTTQKCEHPACNCVVPNGKKYCSEACADKKKTPELRLKSRLYAPAIRTDVVSSVRSFVPFQQ